MSSPAPAAACSPSSRSRSGVRWDRTVVSGWSSSVSEVMSDSTTTAYGASASALAGNSRVAVWFGTCVTSQPPASRAWRKRPSSTAWLASP